MTKKTKIKDSNGNISLPLGETIFEMIIFQRNVFLTILGINDII
jgi:hypothetical protein